MKAVFTSQDTTWDKHRHTGHHLRQTQTITVSHFGEHKRLHLESSKQNYYIISLREIIQPIFTSQYTTWDKHKHTVHHLRQTQSHSTPPETNTNTQYTSWDKHKHFIAHDTLHHNNPWHMVYWCVTCITIIHGTWHTRSCGVLCVFGCLRLCLPRLVYCVFVFASGDVLCVCVCLNLCAIFHKSLWFMAMINDMTHSNVTWLISSVIWIILSQHEVCYPCTVERLVGVSPFFLLFDTSLVETLLIHPFTMLWSRCYTRIIVYIDSTSLFVDLFPSSCHTIPVLAHLLFCWSLSNLLPHPAVPRQLSIFIVHRTSFPARLLPCANCSICPVVLFRWNIFA